MTFLFKVLGFDPKQMKLRTEIIAGATTFLTMSYILAVNPAILASTGMDKGALFTATALASAIATFLLAFMAKLPFAQAPSMGLNAFFAYTLCQAMGYTWQHSLAIMLIEGFAFILITFLNVREMILSSIPYNLRFAISAGIGMFIAFIGLKNAGIIVAKEATFVGLGAFTPTCIIGVIAILLSGVLMANNIKGSLFWSIIITTIIGIPIIVVIIILQKREPFILFAISTPLSNIAITPIIQVGVKAPKPTKVASFATIIPAFFKPIKAINIPIPADIAKRKL